MFTQVSGWPRIGAGRALKFATESWLRGEIDEATLQAKAASLRLIAWNCMKAAGIDRIPSQDFSFYDGMLDTAIRFSAIPARFRIAGASRLETAFAMARGTPERAPLPMKKWFITNYHYIVPELDGDTELRLSESPEEAFSGWLEARAAGIETVPTFIGPWTFLSLCRYGEGRGPSSFADGASRAWAELIAAAERLGVREIRFEEPALTLDTGKSENALFARIWERLLAARSVVRITAGFPFGDIRDSWDVVAALPFDGIALDFVDGTRNLGLLRERGFPADRELSVGLVNGRNVRKNRQDDSVALLREIARRTKAPLGVETSCSLLHVPISLAEETELDPLVREGLAFASEKLGELVSIARKAERSRPSGRGEGATGGEADGESVERSDGAGAPDSGYVPDTVPFRSPSRSERRAIQAARFKLPPLPLTTIGSFPQSAEVRALRSRLRSAQIGRSAYDGEIFRLIEECVRYQERLGLDVLVHGEFERNDMVEFFAESLAGFAFTRHGWVQSYGTRCVKPPVVSGDVRRARSLTADLAVRAQSLTDKPVKGMLTGPATVLAWSFPREDISLAESAFQIARALREEVLELERRGIAIIQIDEAALREKMPARKADRAAYLGWAIPAFRLCHASVRAETQIHTHMCYSDFTEIIREIDGMDADVITFEAARSAESLAETLAREGFETAVGPGVWDIHSPRVPSAEELAERILAMARAPGADPGWIGRLWVNPDCGLKTRGWAETRASLENLVAATLAAREALAAAGKNVPGGRQ